MNRKLAFVFPGQGSQSIGMLQSLATEFPLVEQTFQEASDILSYDLWQLSQSGPEDEINRTEKTQPLLLAASVAVWRVWQQVHGEKPLLMAGHSLGEYTALVCANSIHFHDALNLVELRGRCMQSIVPEGVGAMAAVIGLDPVQVQEVCIAAAENEVVTPANYNAKGQIVISGHKKAVERAIVLAKSAGAKIAKLIPVSVPSHCPLMRDAADKLAEQLTKISIQIPDVPVINNVDVCIATHVDDIRDALMRQLYYPVRWVETIEAFVTDGIELVIECGPGKILAGLIKRIDRNLVTKSVYEPNILEELLGPVD